MTQAIKRAALDYAGALALMARGMSWKVALATIAARRLKERFAGENETPAAAEPKTEA